MRPCRLSIACLVLLAPACARPPQKPATPASTKQITTPAKQDHRLMVGPGELYFHVQTFDDSAPYILFLNGGPGDVSVRARALFETIGLGLNTIFLDQRGCGRSTRDVPKDAFKFENLIRDIDAVLDELGLAKVLLVGHSWGGIYGAKYALARPDRVLGLVAVSPMDSWRRALDRFYDAAPKYAQHFERLLHEAKATGDVSSTDRAELISFCQFMLAHEREPGEQATFEACVHAPDRLDFDAALAELKDDQIEVARHRDSDERWRGWSARGIRKKYGLYRYSAQCPEHCEATKRLVAELYDDKDLAYSTAMEKGLWVNQGWGEYDMLDDLAKLNGEHFYLYGRHDELFGSPTAAALVTRRFGPEHAVEFEFAGHSPMMESPEAFKETLIRIYKGVSKPMER